MSSSFNTLSLLEEESKTACPVTLFIPLHSFRLVALYAASCSLVSSVTASSKRWPTAWDMSWPCFCSPSTPNPSTQSLISRNPSFLPWLPQAMIPPLAVLTWKKSSKSSVWARRPSSWRRRSSHRQRGCWKRWRRTLRSTARTAIAGWRHSKMSWQ